jgi:hypothetical protein
MKIVTSSLKSISSCSLLETGLAELSETESYFLNNKIIERISNTA